MIDKTKWTLKDQKFMRCMCCEGITIHRHEGWWIHKKCKKELIGYLKLWDASAYGLKMEIIDWKKALTLAVNWDSVKIKDYNKELTSEAFELFTERQGRPSWVKNEEAGKESG